MLTTGDKIKMVTPIGGFNCLTNRIFEVTKVNDGVISLKSSLGVGCMSEDEFKKHFVMIRNWTPWIHTVHFYAYKTDNRKYVKVKMDGIQVRASCHPNDTFDLKTGINICLGKIKAKQQI